MFEKERCEARRKLLNSRDVISFETVPLFIVNSFFGQCTYLKRLHISTFCFLNGVSPSQCQLICFFDDPTLINNHKIEALYNYLKLKQNMERYYSYSVHYKKILYLNGDLRLHGQRILHHNLFDINNNGNVQLFSNPSLSQELNFNKISRNLQRIAAKSFPNNPKTIEDIIHLFQTDEIYHNFGLFKHEEALPFYRDCVNNPDFAYMIFASTKMIGNKIYIY